VCVCVCESECVFIFVFVCVCVHVCMSACMCKFIRTCGCSTLQNVMLSGQNVFSLVEGGIDYLYKM
jgi:hypothetical protein